MTYPKVSHTDATTVASSPRFPEIEEAVLAYWESDDTFRASVEQREAGTDGGNRPRSPPVASSRPGVGLFGIAASRRVVSPIQG
jgi:isoleucyl-tRNA synthetase